MLMIPSRLHFAKILKDGESDAAAVGDGSSTPTAAGKKRTLTAANGGKSPTKQPAKRQRKATPTKGGKAAKGKAAKGDDDDEVEEDDDDDAADTLVKQEVKEESGIDSYDEA